VFSETTITEGDDGGEGAGGLHLLVMSPELFASHALPRSGLLTIGRSSRCAVRIGDPIASREHARLHVDMTGGAPKLSIEDLGSANGTRVREVAIAAGAPTEIAIGEGVLIGSTVVMVLPNRAPSGLQRLWSHASFGARVDEACALAATSAGRVALARVRFGGPASWTRILPALARVLVAEHGIAVYGPKDYEILFLGMREEDVRATMDRLMSALAADGLDARGAVAFHPKNGRTFDALIESANALLKLRPGVAPAREPAVAISDGMRRVHDMATKVAGAQINVLIRGETGVGKDVLARLIHRTSPRADKPFLALNCAGLPDTLLESELFGHAKGTFTGATSAKQGLLETADGGTVFLDEIGDMPIAIQARLLRVIEDRQIRPLGTVGTRAINIRFLAATNKDLDDAVARGTFRQDLMFRLNGVTLQIPPLRQRRDEIATLAKTFAADASREMGRDPELTVSDDALAVLLAHDWPGNIRELRNVIERAVVLCEGADILPDNLELSAGAGAAAERVSAELAGRATPTGLPRALPNLSDPMRMAERQRILDALQACASNQTRAAQMLGMPRRTFVSKLDYYQIPRPQKGAGS
jgi:DNA-binding NtrC family response regulator